MGQRDRLLAGGGLADHADALIVFEQRPETGAYHRLAIGDQDPDGRRWRDVPIRRCRPDRPQNRELAARVATVNSRECSSHDCHLASAPGQDRGRPGPPVTGWMLHVGTIPGARSARHTRSP